jgi:hypothetical protein
MSCAELHFQRSESAESQYVYSSKCKWRRRNWDYKGEIQHRGRMVKVWWRFRGNLIDSSWCSEHWICIQDSIQYNGWDCWLAWHWELLVLSETACSKPELSWQFVLHTLLGLDVGGNQILSVYHLSRTSDVQEMRCEGACRSPIKALCRDWHSDSISSSSLDGN